MTEREIKYPGDIRREQERRREMVNTTAAILIDHIELAADLGGFMNRRVFTATTPQDSTKPLPIGMKHRWSVITQGNLYDPYGFPLSIAVDRLGGTGGNFDTTITVRTGGDGEYLEREINSQGNVNVVGAVGRNSSPKVRATGIQDLDSLLGVADDAPDIWSSTDWHHALAEAAHKDTFIYRFHQGVVALCDGGDSSLTDPHKLASMFGLASDQKDGKKFIRRFAEGVTHPKFVPHLQNDDFNRYKTLLFGPSMRGVKHMMELFEKGEATQQQIQFLDALGHCAYRQFSRENIGDFCDIGLDYIIEYNRIAPDRVATVFPSPIELVLAPEEKWRKFTNVKDSDLTMPAKYAVDLIDLRR